MASSYSSIFSFVLKFNYVCKISFFCRLYDIGLTIVYFTYYLFRIPFTILKGLYLCVSNRVSTCTYGENEICEHDVFTGVEFSVTQDIGWDNCSFTAWFSGNQGAGIIVSSRVIYMSCLRLKFSFENLFQYICCSVLYSYFL